MKLSYYKVSTESVVRERHERLIVARSPEEALAEYNKGTAWPSDYDTQHVETISKNPTEVVVSDDPRYGDPSDPANTHARAYYTRKLKELIPYPDNPSPERDLFLSRGGDSYEDD